MGKKTSWFTLTTTQCKEIENVGMRSGWKLLSQESLPSVLPLDFRKKVDTAVMIAAPTSTGGTFLVYNNLRVDHKTAAVDQHAFCPHGQFYWPKSQWIVSSPWKMEGTHYKSTERILGPC